MIEIFFQEDAHEARMPVVAVDDVRLESHFWEHGQDGAAEISEPFVVVIKPIEAVPLEIPFVIDEVDRDAVPVDFFHAIVELAPGQVDDAVSDRFHLCPERFGDLAVFGNDQTHIHPFGCQCLRQRSHDICQASGLDKRNGLGSRKQYFYHLYHLLSTLLKL